MLTLEFKAYGKTNQFKSIDEAIKIAQFIRNKCIRLWMDTREVKSGFDLNKYSAVLAKEFDFVNKLNSMARQSSAERAWFAISRFYSNCKSGLEGKKGYPKFKKDSRSVEYKTTGWKLSEDRKSITFTDKCGIGRLKMKGTRDLGFYDLDQFKRVRIVKRADGYYIQFCVKAERLEDNCSTGEAIGLDVGLKEFYTDSNGTTVSNPRFLRKGEEVLKAKQRKVSKKIKGSANRLRAITVLSLNHLKISRQRKDFAIKLARCVIKSNDFVVYEDLRISNMIKNHCLAKSIADVAWYQFREYLEYFGRVFNKVTLAVNPAYTSQECSNCGSIVKKSLSTRTHICECGCILDRDHNAALNILNKGLNTVGHTGIYA